MRPAVAMLAVILWTGAPVDGSGATGGEPPSSTAAVDRPAAAIEADANKPQEVTLPPGFKKKKRGKYILYCKTESTTGSRFTFERCLDDAQLRDYILALQENKRDLDHIRSTCANICTCGQPGAC